MVSGDFWFGGGFPWNFLNIGSLAWGIFMLVYGLPEITGRRWHIRSPHLRSTNTRWDAIDIATCGILTAVNVVLYLVLGGVSLIPGLPGFTAGWVIAFGFWAAFPLLFGTAVGGLANGLAVWIVDPLVGAPPFSLNGFIRVIVIGSCLVRVLGNDPEKVFETTTKKVQYVAIGLVLVWLLNNNFWIAQMSILGLIPAEVNYVATYLTPVYPFYLIFGFYVLGPIFIRVFAGKVKQFGLLSMQRHVPRD